MKTITRKIKIKKPALFDIYKYISSDPQIMHGKPCIIGTRIPVSLIVSMIADGMSITTILREYPSLTKDSIKAALKYASQSVEHNSEKI